MVQCKRDVCVNSFGRWLLGFRLSCRVPSPAWIDNSIEKHDFKFNSIHGDPMAKHLFTWLRLEKTTSRSATIPSIYGGIHTYIHEEAMFLHGASIARHRSRIRSSAQSLGSVHNEAYLSVSEINKWTVAEFETLLEARCVHTTRQTFYASSRNKKHQSTLQPTSMLSWKL